MKILVTGGAGYIGSTIASALEEAGHTPIILDSLITGRVEFTRVRTFYQGDIADSTINVVCGWTQAQVAEVVRLAVSPVAADRAELMARLDELLPASSSLRVEAVARFFAILGEKEVPSERLADRFAEIAENHRRLLEEAAPCGSPIRMCRRSATRATSA